jgi:hypothetical protein
VGSPSLVLLVDPEDVDSDDCSEVQGDSRERVEVSLLGARRPHPVLNELIATSGEVPIEADWNVPEQPQIGAILGIVTDPDCTEVDLGD